MKNKTTIISCAVTAAVAASAGVALSGLGVEKYDIDYHLTAVNEYVTEMSIDASEEMGADIVVLKVNGAEVDTALLPNGKLSSLPIVFSDLDNLSLDLYQRGKKIGTAEFNDKTLTAEVRK